MTLQIVRTRQAQADLESIFDYLDTQSPNLAERFADEIDKNCSLYAKHPLMGASAEELATDLRVFTVWSYAVFYRRLEQGIEVIRILHGARDLPRLF